MERDPVKAFAKRLLKEKVLTADMIATVAKEADEEAAAAAKFAFESPFPDPARLRNMVYAS
jgi:TPP-dependent pyruvate/acetoin dehydrogenase alpha subunit